MNIRIDVEKVMLRYPSSSENALEEVTFSLEGPGIHGLLGRNGAGKTSLLSVLAAFRKPSAGTVLLNGAPVYENADVASGICLVSGGGGSVENNWPEDRVDDALAVAAMLRPQWSADYADELLNKFELSGRKRFSELSRGQRAQIGCVLGLASRAPVTVFDETHLGMDAPARHLFYDELLRDNNEHPRLIILSTHLIDEVAPLLEDVVILRDGRVLLHEQVETLRAQGASVTGPADRVDDFVRDLTVLNRQQLGGTTRATVRGQLPAERHAAGLIVEPLALQELFIHLTTTEGVR
ncbi:ABC transporter ATP-binding protein [Nocardia uniformis]|uniref:ABC transporter ATP-binding protein n=1 Tax=Nocardia uniformis TaxID=53432 RepID=A0A849C3E0_9NOCA|nr:ABC transporter ATP-binding protein [Nocardia uniformis]NNH73204.1 ABC transporter ATP-binding protein [Nocardia uniformis]